MKRYMITLYVCLKNAHVETTFSILKIIYIYTYIYIIFKILCYTYFSRYIDI